MNTDRTRGPIVRRHVWLPGGRPTPTHQRTSKRDEAFLADRWTQSRPQGHALRFDRVVIAICHRWPARCVTVS